ncbi:uncharacterized protein TrAtP1_011994 [Trichoderma atroviride]|uniref:uncharacterized protein n=1 Tax=Hypocrea atroviridis TaxID=63577 RepID=UPI00331B6669|nr:hypothetical protein TrAtP1_011994 [Trichoderma atroviride]
MVMARKKKAKTHTSLKDTYEEVYGSSQRVWKLGISEYIVQAPNSWSARQPYFDEIYRALPYGSNIVFENIVPFPSQPRIRIIPDNTWGERLLSIETLRDFLDLPPNGWPASIHMNSLEVVFQINENVALVRAPKIGGSTPFIFKTNVAGFLSEYYPKGNLRDVLESKSPIPSILQLKWSIQIAETLQHVRASPARFYSDLKPDNLVISGLGRDIIFIDFEQAGNWDTFQPSETFYLTWMEKLSARREVLEVRRKKYKSLLDLNIPHPSSKEWACTNPSVGYFDAWTNLSPYEQEQALVFSLGKVLWCIFEGCSHTRNSIDEEYEREVDHEFPEFRRTSEPLQQLIRKCMYGAPEYNSTEQFHQVRDGPRVNVESSAGSEWSCHGSPREVLEAARTLWSDRLSRMERYVEAKGRWMQNSHQEGDVQLLGFPLRPTLAETLEILNNELRDTVFRA